MIEFTQIFVFIAATLILNLTPGADVLYIASQTLKGDKKYGLYAALGISSGIVIHIFAVSFGLAELLQHCPKVFFAIKITGAFYLLVLAWKAFTTEGASLENLENIGKNLWKTYLKGIFTTLLNPKVVLFFLTFLPQFVIPEKGNITLQFLFLGGLFVFLGTIVNLVYVAVISKVRERILHAKVVTNFLNKLTGVIFGYLAYRLVIAEVK